MNQLRRLAFATPCLLLSLLATGCPCCGGDIFGLEKVPPLRTAAGDNQVAVVGTAVAIAPRVVIAGTQGQSQLSDYKIVFVVASGGGSVTGATQVTDQTGVATVGSWTLGLLPGPNTLVAKLAYGLRPDTVSVTFRATGTAPH